MMRRLATWAVLAFCVAGVCSGVGATTPLPLTADQLVARMVEVRKATGFRIRATLTRTTSGSNTKDVRQLLIKGRRGPDGATVLYQQLWPAVKGGRALVIDTTGNHRLKGFQYESGTVTPLTGDMLSRPLFGSDVLLEDLAEGFWYWPSRRVAGEEFIGENRCVIIDLRPGPATPTTYSLVKTWVSPDRAVLLRAQMFARDGRLLKQVDFYRVLKIGERWVPGILTVEHPDRQTRTVIEGVKVEHDVQVPASDFTVAAITRIVSEAK